MDANGPCLLGNACNKPLNLLRRHHHQVRKLVHYYDNIGKFFILVAVFLDLFVIPVNVPRIELGQQPVAALHFEHRPLQGLRGHMGLSDYRRQHVGKPVIQLEFYHLRIHHNEPHIVGAVIVHEAGYN